MALIDKNRLFGQIAVKLGLITEADRVETLSHQSDDISNGINKHIGIYFFEKNLLNKEQIQKILEYQKKLINSHLQNSTPAKSQSSTVELTLTENNGEPAESDEAIAHKCDSSLSPETLKIIEAETRYKKLKVFFSAAAKNSPAAILNSLKSGMDINIKNKMGFTALMLAAHSNSAAALKTLLENGADVHAASATGHTALNFAGINLECVEVLREFSSHYPIPQPSESEKRIEAASRNEVLNSKSKSATAKTIQSQDNDDNSYLEAPAEKSNKEKTSAIQQKFSNRSSLFIKLFFLSAALLAVFYFGKPYYLEYSENKTIAEIIAEKNEEEIVNYIKRHLNRSSKKEKLKNIISKTMNPQNEKCIEYYEDFALSNLNKYMDYSLLILSLANNYEITFKNSDSLLTHILLTPGITDEIKIELEKMASRLTSTTVNESLKNKIFETHKIFNIEASNIIFKYYEKYNSIALTTIENALLREMKVYNEMEFNKKLNVELNAEIEKYDEIASVYGRLKVIERSRDGYYLCEKISGQLPDGEFIISSLEKLEEYNEYELVLTYQGEISMIETVEYSRPAQNDGEAYRRYAWDEYLKKHPTVYTKYGISSVSYNRAEEINKSREISSKAYDKYLTLENEFKIYHEVSTDMLNDHFKIITSKKKTNNIN